MHKQKDKSFQ